MIKDAFIYFLSKLIPSIISFGILFLYLNHLGPEQYGLYSLVLVSIGLVNIFLNQWIRSSYLRFKYRFTNSDDIFFSKQLLLLLISNFLLGIILMYVDLNIKLIIFSLSIFSLLVINEFYNIYFRILLKPLVILKGNLIKNGVFIIVLIIFIYSIQMLNVYLALGAYGLGLLISSLYYIAKSNIKITLHFNVRYLQLSLSYGLPITLSFALGVFLQNIDKYMITYLLDIESTGNYSMGFDFIHNFLYMMMASLATASLPRIIKESKNFNMMMNQYKDYTQLFVYITIPIVLTLITVSGDISDVFIKFDYYITPYLVVFIILATFAHGMKTYIYDQALQLYEKTTLIFLPTTVAIIINISVNIMFLEEYGVIIASVSTLVAFSVSAFLTYLLIRKEVKIQFDSLFIITMLIVGIVIYYLLNSIILDNLYLSIILKSLISFIIFSLVSAVFIYFRRSV